MHFTLMLRQDRQARALLDEMAVVAGILIVVLALLPEGHTPDPGISLRPGVILAEYLTILRHPRFHRR